MCNIRIAGKPHVSLPTKPWKNQSHSPTRETITKPHLLLPPAETLKKAAAPFHLSFPIAVTALLIYSRSVLSMIFLGFLGDLPLAAGSLAIAFANITGYSVLPGLSLGMEPLCSQAFGAAAVGVGMVAMGFAAGLGERWDRLFTSDGEILRLTAAALPVVGLCELGRPPHAGRNY
ncbi:hypothetical protein COCNU_scaffold008923G000040 [Cocos nucifera]|nr:hypothetical protein [Cocos nucifera]